MKFEIIDASYLIRFQQALRSNNGKLVRARPFKNASGADCYEMMFLENSIG